MPEPSPAARKPYIGAIVHYQVSATWHERAFITRVNPDGTVDLKLIRPALPEQLQRKVAFSKAPRPRFWSWR